MITRKYAAFLKAIESQREERAAEYADLVGNLRDMVGRPLDPTSTAARIVTAGRRRRNELNEPPQFSDDKAGRFAKRVYNAAARRDGKPEIK
jgi:hypothetical protein